MPITAKEVLHRARITLNDANSVRWTLVELLLYLNDALREVAIYKPDAVSKTVEIALAEGTYQVHGHLHLIRVIRNITSAEGATPRIGGRAITPTERPILDATMPGWQDPNVLPFSATVDHVVQDVMDKDVFYVVPGNTGAGLIEAIVADIPDEIAEPENPLSIDSYTAEIQIGPIYRAALVDYVLYRAFSKDGFDPANANRALAHYNQFASALGIKTQSDQRANLDSPEHPGQPMRT